jgi:hypothetical protein
MHGLVVPCQTLLLGELLVAFEALKVLARLAVVNASFVAASVDSLRAEPSQTLVALRSIVAIEDRCFLRGFLFLFSIFSLSLRSCDDMSLI